MDEVKQARIVGLKQQRDAINEELAELAIAVAENREATPPKRKWTRRTEETPKEA